MLMPTFGKKSVPNMISYLHGASKTRAFCSSIRLFLSNSGSLMSLSVITSAAATLPASVVSVLVVLSFFGLVPHGKAERLISVLRDPESKRIRNIL